MKGSSDVETNIEGEGGGGGPPTAAIGGGAAVAVLLMVGLGFLYLRKKRMAGSQSPGTPVAASANAARPADVQVQITPPPASPHGQGPVVTKLKELELEQYASAFFDQGYDSMASLHGLTKKEAGEIADEIKMKPGHKKRFVDGIAN